MRLARCPICNQIIDLDDIDELPSDTVIGCGLNVGDFFPCDGCPEENNPDECDALRGVNGLTKTTIADKMEELNNVK